MQHSAWWPTVIVLVIACITDLRERRIPNWLVVPFLVAGPLRAVLFYGWTGLIDSLEGFALAALITGVLWWMRGLGMGDVKLCAALGAWIGPSQMMLALVLTALAGGILAVCWALYNGALRRALRGAWGLVLTLLRKGTDAKEDYSLRRPGSLKMPYAPAIAVGTLISFFSLPGF